MHLETPLSCHNLISNLDLAKPLQEVDLTSQPGLAIRQQVCYFHKFFSRPGSLEPTFVSTQVSHPTSRAGIEIPLILIWLQSSPFPPHQPSLLAPNPTVPHNTALILAHQ